MDFVLAVGGGSVIDSAKSITYGLAYEGDVWDLFDGKTKAKECYPVGTVLTHFSTAFKRQFGILPTQVENI